MSAVKCSLSKQTWSWLDGAAADGGKKLRLVASDGEASASPPKQRQRPSAARKMTHAFGAIDITLEEHGEVFDSAI